METTREDRRTADSKSENEVLPSVAPEMPGQMLLLWDVELSSEGMAVMFVLDGVSGR